MMNKGFTIIAILSASLQSCISYYVPNENSTPMLSQEKQVIISGSASMGLKANTFTGTAAYAINKHIGLTYQFGGFNESPNSEPPTSTWKKIRNQELSIGYFHLNPENVLFEVYLSHGFGRSLNNYYNNRLFNSPQITRFNINYDKTALNFAIGKVSKNFSFSFFTKLGTLDFNNISIIKAEDLGVYQDLKDIRTARFFNIIEPGLTAKMGVDNFKFYMKGSFCFISNNSSNITNINSSINNQQFQVTFGLQLELNKIKKPI